MDGWMDGWMDGNKIWLKGLLNSVRKRITQNPILESDWRYYS
jgi:uncharacterized protein with von Willebrand factor type A (vWA) domain